ncbi:helix-turn-helix domain-containing protein [Roseovarius sp. B08]|uniref:helix-turn-helix domain-containing protein n=1 Tax=Roseovarius sp. B08 TaxID=3449223 RepID=UPI003EDBB410
MTIEEREQLFRLNDDSDEAVALRLRAAREVAGYKKQRDFAEALDLNYQTYHSQEKKGRPSPSTVRFLYRNHRIDFNFVYNGDFLQLPGDVQAALEKALSATN